MPSTVMGYLSVGVNLDHSPGAGNVERMTVPENRQDGFHLDGSGDGRRTTVGDIVRPFNNL
jgi:hypothetical protein